MDAPVVRALAELRAAPVLLLAALDEHITELACAMPNCICPNGRTYFERRGDPRYGAWAPSADRWPFPGRDGGEYLTTNVRLAHKKCNQSEGGRIGGIRGAAALTYEQRAAGGRAAAALINATWAKTPEGRAQRRSNGAAWGAKSSTARKASGQYQSPEHRALGRRLSERGLPAIRLWEKTPEAHEVRVANGHKLGDWIARNRASPIRLAGQSLGGTVSGCKRYRVDRGKPCTCGRH